MNKKLFLFLLSVIILHSGNANKFVYGNNFIQDHPKGGIIKGSVISADETEVVIRGDIEGRVIVTKVLNRRRPDGTRGPEIHVSKFTSNLKPNDKIIVNYGYAIEGEFFYIKAIQFTSGESGAFMRTPNLISGWVIHYSDGELKIETVETGKEKTFRVPMRRSEDGHYEFNQELLSLVSELLIGQFVIVRYRGREGQEIMNLQDIKTIEF